MHVRNAVDTMVLPTTPDLHISAAMSVAADVFVPFFFNSAPQLLQVSAPLANALVEVKIIRDNEFERRARRTDMCVCVLCAVWTSLTCCTCTRGRPARQDHIVLLRPRPRIPEQVGCAHTPFTARHQAWRCACNIVVSKKPVGELTPCTHQIHGANVICNR